MNATKTIVSSLNTPLCWAMGRFVWFKYDIWPLFDLDLTSSRLNLFLKIPSQLMRSNVLLIYVGRIKMRNFRISQNHMFSTPLSIT